MGAITVAGLGTGELPMAVFTDPALNVAVSTAIIDSNSGVIITLTAAGNNQTLQNPTDLIPGKRFTVVADNENGVHTIEINGITVSAGEAQRFIWDGSAWVAVTAIDADDMAFTPAGDIVAIKVQTAIEEVDTKKLAKANNLSDVSNAVTSFTNIKQNATELITGVLEIATNAEAAAEVATDKALVPSNIPSLSITPDTHKDTHDPEDGSDPLDCAIPSELIGVQSAGEGSSHSFARSDHDHQIQHGLANNHLVTIDHDSVADDDYAKFTGDGLEGRSASEVKADLGFMTELADDGTPQAGGILESNSHQVRWSKGSDVASANALTLGADGNYFDITGTTAITSIGTLGIGVLICLHFDGALILTHDGTNLILSGEDDITTVAGDEAIFIEYATGDWRCICYNSVLATPNSRWLVGRNYAGSANVNMFKVNVDDEIDVGGTLVLGASLEAAEDAGLVVLSDMPISATPTQGDEMSFTQKIDGTNILKVYAEADSSGGIQNPSVRPAAPIIYDQAPQVLTGAGAVDITSAITHIVTDGVNALTLADGVEGQTKFIVMKTDVNTGTLQPLNLGNGTTITFDDIGDSAQLLFTNAAWHFMGGTATLA